MPHHWKRRQPAQQVDVRGDLARADDAAHAQRVRAPCATTHVHLRCARARPLPQGSPDFAVVRLLQGASHRLKQHPRANPAEWAERRARHRPWNSQPGKGGAVGSRAALREAQRWVLCCHACGSLVDFKAACRQARVAGRDSVAAGDGCASSTCSASHRRARFARRQLACASSLLTGAKKMIAVPVTLTGADVYVYSSTVASKVAGIVMNELA